MAFKLNTSRTLVILAMLVGIVLIGRYLYMQPRFEGGEGAPEIEAVLASGRDFKLSDLRGHFALLDFWGSWCGPCRAQSPALVALYNKYKDAKFKDAEGFDIVSIGIETKEGRWQRAVQKDGKFWPYHIIDKASDLRFINSPIAKVYGIKAVPTKYFIDPEGQIIGVNLPFEKMDEILKEELKTN